MEKKHLNEIVIFDRLLLEDCKNTIPGALGSKVTNPNCSCERHGPFFWLKKSIRKDAIALVKIHLKENKQKAYEVEKEDLEKLIKKKESRVRQKNWKKILLRGALYSSGLSWLTWK